MEFKYCILGCLILALISGANGITVSISGGDGDESYGSATSLQAIDSGLAMGSALLSESGLSQNFKGSGNLMENHSVYNGIGYYAVVGARVIDADRYDYSYTISPNNLDHVVAIQSLNVGDATFIKAWSKSINAREYEAHSHINVIGGGLRGYTSSAYANESSVSTTQAVNGGIDYANYIVARAEAYGGDENYTLVTCTNSELREGGLNWYYGGLSIDDNVTRASQSLSSDYAKSIKSYNDAVIRRDYDHGFPTKDNYAYVDVEVCEGDLLLYGDSHANLNGAEAHHFIESNYARYIASITGLSLRSGIYNMSGCDEDYKFNSSRAHATSEVRGGGLILSGSAYADDKSTEAYQDLYSSYANQIKSQTDAYKGLGEWHHSNGKYWDSDWDIAEVSTGIELTNGGGWLHGTASVDENVLHASLPLCVRNGIDYARDIRVTANACYLDEDRNWICQEKKLNVTNGGLSAKDIHANVDGQSSEVVID